MARSIGSTVAASAASTSVAAAAASSLAGTSTSIKNAVAGGGATSNENKRIVKELWIVRHGQATHNPRAEAEKEAGCSFEEFLELMRQDDSLDSALTDLGRKQAQTLYEQHIAKKRQYWQSKIDLVVSSPLSRAIETADHALPSSVTANRIVHEEFREVNGWLLNAKRRTKSELLEQFPHWDFNHLEHDEDILWKPEMETQEDCAERGYQGLNWILHHRPERNIFLVAHGGILRFLMQLHPCIKVQDSRSTTASSSPTSEEATPGKVDDQSSKGRRPANARFSNCELRRYRVEFDDTNSDTTPTMDESDGTSTPRHRRCIVLTEVDLYHDDNDDVDGDKVDE